MQSYVYAYSLSLSRSLSPRVCARTLSPISRRAGTKRGNYGRAIASNRALPCVRETSFNFIIVQARERRELCFELATIKRQFCTDTSVFGEHTLSAYTVYIYIYVYIRVIHSALCTTQRKFLARTTIKSDLVAIFKAWRRKFYLTFREYRFLKSCSRLIS